MSLESSRFINTSSSPNLLETFQSRNFHDHMNQSAISKKENLFKTEAVNFVKTSLNSLIKDELKGYRMQKTLQKQLEEFKKNQQRKQLIDDLHKVQKFRQKQSEQLKARLDQYQKQQQTKKYVIEQVGTMKKQMAKRKKLEHDRKMQHVRKRFMHSQMEDIQNRISRVDSTMSQKSTRTKERLTTSRPRNIHSSTNQRKYIIHQAQDEELKRITNYLRKMKHAQSRIIEKQITNEERKQKSIKSEVKNLTKERDQKEETVMDRWQERLESRMGSFYENLARSQFENSNLMMNKSRMKQQLRQRILKNKETKQNLLMNKTLGNYMRKKADKQNLYKNYQRKIDLIRTKSSLMNNTIQIQKQQLEKESEKNLRILYEKMNRIKHLRPNEILNEKQKQTLLNFLDAEDPFYPEMTEFLSNTKSEFLRKKIQKEEEKAKADKTKKTARFHKN